MSDPVRGLGALSLSIDDDALAAIATYANGDARIALNLLDMALPAVHCPPGVPAGTIDSRRSSRTWRKTGRSCTTRRAKSTTT